MAWESLTSLFGGNRSKGVSVYEDKMPIPPSGGGLVPPPKPPKGFNTKQADSTTYEFKGFTPPPKVNDGSGYESKDYSDYLLPDTSKDLYNKPAEIVNKLFKSPRAKNCYESIKLGWKMGGAVGGIFGALTGGYGALRNRNILIFPISVVGGAVSFGFFLGNSEMNK
ncbi:hypothetical protein MACJ_003238 [Theileria orientalis]|uniref:Uncharacterized protein n=1 Tax=Theileria orientalis TaxID=68886 RepID=A0A976M7H4_THEOR|nr:hypothetical protein MACJ_003238 [Theileria orientalis]